jgi:F-type H+-transporting ATPase subunit epsilon
MLTLDIVTPEKKILSEDQVSIITVMTTEGEIGVLPHHVPLYAKLQPGELKYKKDGHDHYVAIHGGFIEVTPTKVTILADDAVRAEDISEELAEQARLRAEELMAQKVTDADFVHAEAAMRRALLELKVVQKRRTHL